MSSAQPIHFENSNANDSQESLLVPLLSNSDDTANETGGETETASLSKHDDNVAGREDVSGENGPSVEGRLLLNHERYAAERKLVRKLDSRLMACVFIIYIMNYVSA
jgi:hypothetical protein